MESTTRRGSHSLATPKALVLAVGILLIPGCGGESDGAPAISVRDSLGIEIVENSSPMWVEGSAWTITPEPALEIGDTEAGHPPLLDVRAVRLNAAGRVLVATGRPRELFMFDMDGGLIEELGGAR